MPIFAAFFAVAPEMLAAEAAAVTAAEIAAAEAAAVAAAEAAATTAAQQAAVTTATDAAATAAAQQAATAAAQQGAQAGITQIGGTAANAPLTSEAVNAAAQQANAGIQGLPQGFEQQLQNIQNMSQGPSVQVASTNPGAGLDSLRNAGNISDAAMRAGTNPSIPSGVTDQMLSSGYTPPPPAAPPAPSYLQTPTVAPGSGPMTPFEYRLNAPLDTTQSVRAGTSTSGINMPNTQISSVSQTPMAQPPSPLMKGLNSATEWAKANPFSAMTGAYGAANMLGLMKPSGETFGDKKYDGPLNKYRLSDDFQAGSANPADFQYTPRRYVTGGGVMGDDPYSIPVGYAEGNDVQGYAKGGSLSESIEQYQKMLDGKPQAAPARSADVGIYYDQDPDTRYQDALTAAQIRQAKVNQRAYVSPPVAKRPTPMGQLQMASVKPRKQGGDDVEAARGGIMQSYADGGITGDGNLNLQIPLNLGGGGGGGGGGGFGGYTPAGGGNVNPNTGGGGFGGLGGGGQSQGGLGGMLQGIAGLLGKSGYDPRAVAANPQGFMDDMRQMDMFSHGPNPFMGGGSSRLSQPGQYDNMIAPAVMNYQDVIGGRNNMMVSDAQYRPERNLRASFHDIQTAPSYGNNFAGGGITSLGGYAAGGNPRLLKGPGDGMSDNIPATINGRQPARLADGEFVVPADVVSHLGNGSTEAGAKQLHAMMDKVRSARTGNKKQGKQIKPQKYLPK